MRYQETGKTDAWDFVGIVQERDDPDKRSVILRPDRGPDISVPLETFQRDYKLLSGRSSPGADAIRETLANIRQISTIRFVALPFFLTASAALAKAYSTEPWSQTPMFAEFALGLALVGVTFEIVLSRNLKCWWEALRKDVTAPPWSMIYAHRDGLAVWAARIALFLPYLAMVFYWALQIGWEARWAWGLSAILLLSGITVWVRAKPQ